MSVEKKTIIINVDTKTGQKNSEELANDIASIGVAADTTNAKLGQLENQQKENSVATRDMTDEVSKNGGAMGILNSLTGGMAQQFKDSYEAIQLSSSGLKGFRAALLATGIGVAVIGIGLLIAHWEDFNNLLSASYSRIQDINRELVTLQNNQSILSEQLKLVEAQEEAIIAQGGSLDDIIAKKISILEAEQQITGLEISKTAVLVEQLKLQALELTLAENLLNIARLGIGLPPILSEITDEEIQAIRDAEQSLVSLQAELVATGTAIFKLRNPDPIITKPSPITTPPKTPPTGVTKGLFDDTFSDVAAAQGSNPFEDTGFGQDQLPETPEFVRAAEEHQKNLKMIDEKEEAELKAEQNVQAAKEATLNIAKGVFDAVGSLATEGSDLAKGMAVASTLISTYQAAVAAYASGSAVPIVGIALGPIAAAAAVVMGLANVKKILSTDPVKGTGGGAPNTGSPVTIPNYNSVENSNSAGSQIGTAIDNGFDNQNQTPIKAYVVSTEMTDQQALDRKIEESATI